MFKRLLEIFDPVNKIKKVRLDACSICQLKCVSCENANGITGNNAIGLGYLKAENFQKFIKANPQIKRVELSNWGELFLNPEIIEIMRLGHEAGLELSAGNGANMNTVSDEVLEALVKYKFDYILVSLDGASQETYVEYRRRGNFDQVIANIKKLNEYKKKYNSVFPKLGWQFVVFGHNEKELPKARQMAKELNMEFKPKMNAHEDYSPVQDVEFVKKEIGLNYTSRSEYEKKTGYAFTNPCLQLWQQPQINWDGRLLGCCINVWGDFGNIFEQGLKNILKSERYVYTQQMLLGKKTIRADIPCTKCEVFHKINARTGKLRKK